MVLHRERRKKDLTLSFSFCLFRMRGNIFRTATFCSIAAKEGGWREERRRGEEWRGKERRGKERRDLL